MALNDLKKIKHQIPWQSPVQPVELRADSEFQFHCHKGISCFNACCKNIDLPLLPYDIVRLKRRAKLTSSQWVNRYTLPYAMDAHQLPGLKMATKPGTTECVFLKPSGCAVYTDRPSACRYYALGSMSVRRTPNATATPPQTNSTAQSPATSAATSDDDSDDRPPVDENYFLVKESHCKGHAEPRTLTVQQYRHEQGLVQYDAMNHAWRDLILKKRSCGPTVGKPSERSLQLFDMCSYDIDNFRKFITSSGFAEIFDLPPTEQQALLADEDQLLLFAFRFLKQVLFGEISIPIKPNARSIRLAKNRNSKGEKPPFT